MSWSGLWAGSIRLGSPAAWSCLRAARPAASATAERPARLDSQAIGTRPYGPRTNAMALAWPQSAFTSSTPCWALGLVRCRSGHKGSEGLLISVLVLQNGCRGPGGSRWPQVLAAIAVATG